MSKHRLLPAHISPTDYVASIAAALRRGSLRATARWPLEQQATRRICAQPAVDLSELTGHVTFTATVAASDTRHAWSLHASDQLLLQSLVLGRGVRRAFEIGTFNGGTTRMIAECLPEDGEVWTLDLPPEQFDRTQGPRSFRGADVGRVYLDSQAAHKVVQLLQDSMAFDPEPFRGRCDLVLVDGAHDYEHGLNDTRIAFELVSPDGLIIWDDFQPYWHGLIQGIYEGAHPHRPRRLAGSNLGVWDQRWLGNGPQDAVSTNSAMATTH